FSIEGLDVMVPMLDETIELAAEAGAHEVVIGMAHRGRLNVLAHTIGRPYETILREFEGERTLEAVASDPEGGTGDVKYHLGAEGVRSTSDGEITVTLAANPSHLEALDPVVEGRTRAEQTDRGTRDRRARRGGGGAEPVRGRLPRRLLGPRRRRSRRLSPPRPQRTGRARVHAAAHGRVDREPSDRARAVRRRARRGGRRHPGGGR